MSYRDDSSFPTAVATAVVMWNALPMGIRLVPAPQGAAAKIDIVDVDRRTSWSGLTTTTTLGSPKTIERALIQLNHHYLTDEGPSTVDTAAHELGHALGLPHSDAVCSLMNPRGLLSQPCSNNGACGPQLDDLEGVVARYGGRTSGFAGTRCRG